MYVAQEVTAQVAAAAKGRATDPEAHRLFLQARYLAQQNNRDDARDIDTAQLAGHWEAGCAAIKLQESKSSGTGVAMATGDCVLSDV
jgi:hypothetical protein